MKMLDAWHAQMMRTATHPIDPMQTVMAEGGPHHTQGQLPAYLKRLESTGRAALAERLRQSHATAAAPCATRTSTRRSASPPVSLITSSTVPVTRRRSSNHSAPKSV